MNHARAQLDAAEELDQEGVRQCRSLLSKEMYVPWDRPDFQYATNSFESMFQTDDFGHDESKEICALLNTPTKTLVVLSLT